MLRRYLACLMALLCFFAVPVRASAMNDVADLATLAQWDERFIDNAFRYSNNHFRFAGCGPASVTNGVIAALDVTNQDLAAGMLRDLLYLLTRSRPFQNKIQLALLSYLSFAPGQYPTDERYPSLNKALRDFGGSFRRYDGNINAQNLPSLLPASGSGPMVIHGSFHSDDRWTNIRKLIQVLTDAGYEDARIVLSFLGAGTPGTKSPFRSGSAGHYLCICIQMADFLQTGEFYVIDSLPRALAEEEIDSGMIFQLDYYDFLKPQKPSTSLAEFNALFEVQRVTPTIVRPVPIGQALKNVEAAQQAGTIPLDALMPFLNQVMQFNGSSYLFITLPER